MNLTAHLRVTAELHGVRIVNKPGQTEKACAYPRRRTVSISTIDNERDYLVALHELGHVVLEHGDARPEEVTYAILREELDAWKWAIEHKRCPLTDAGLDEIKTCLMSYVLAAHPDLGIPARAFLKQLQPDGAMATAGPRGRLP